MKHLRQQDAKRNSVNGREEENFVVLFVDFGLMPDRGSIPGYKRMQRRGNH